MYLKSIEVHGFKSFANKMVLDFHNGITGIVGPNGSGKSNIADAVRWVLGEQKVKQLRSSSMQDVIFAGTETRKPVSFAYVAITLDNSDHVFPLDYNEVTVARRVYRSGESEYLINGTACRLKDVHEMFYDTGIGKEGYSIIGQGQIDRILSGKPEERRELFDEAAGIVKYKRRKLAAQKKLENEQQNLVRINDILSELQRQLAPLERQSEEAKVWLKKKEELKAHDIRLFSLEMSRIEQDLKSVEEKYAVADAQQKEVREDYEQIRLGYEKLEEEMEKGDARSGELTQQIADIGVRKEKLEGQINVLREQIHAVEINEEHLSSRMDALDAEIRERQKSGEEYTAERDAQDVHMKEIREEKDLINGQLEEAQMAVADCEEAIEFGKKGILKIVSDRAEIQVEQQRCDTMSEQAGIRRSQLNQQLLSYKSNESDVDERLEAQEKALLTLNEEISGLEKQRDGIRQKRQERKSKLDELRGQLDGQQEEYHRQVSRLESLKNIAERYDGYGNSIRRVMEKKEEIPGICGVVADLVKVDKKYEIAVETALGGSIQNIVTEDEETAKKLISYLKKNRFGRATFLPLSAVKAPEKLPPKAALGETGVIGLADTLVKTDERYRGVAAHLLGRILVADNIDHAVALQRKFHHSLRIVTLEGESLQPGGSMTGGAFRNSSNLLGRSREIETLEKSVTQKTAAIKEIQDHMEDVRTANVLLREDLQEIQNSLQEKYLEQNTLSLEVEHIRAEKEQQEASYRGIKEEIRRIDGQEQEIVAEREHLNEKIRVSEEKEEELRKENERLTLLLEEKTKEVQAVQERLSDVVLLEAQEEQKGTFILENIRRVAEEIRHFEQEKQDLLDHSANSGREIEEKQEQIARITEELAAADSEREVLSGQLAECGEKREQMSAEYKGFFDKRESLSKEINELDKEIFRLNNQREKLEASEESLTDYMWQEYELTRHAALELCTDKTGSVPELKKLIAAAREEIRRLGSVNVNAIEEYKNVSERYMFLHGQQEDLQEAEKNLQEIIADLEEGMRKQFSEKFADIQREFNLAFRELFGGGKGTLELTEDGDLLECGIRIIAQPPGKKLQNMMQLSGGEKALTAIALLFAIQNLKPSPFCLLDEIEAALDDSNVDRFSRYLHKLTKNTQFIIITHRKGTMTAADRLYGITMQEKGVSALVSVNLIEKELDA